MKNTKRLSVSQNAVYNTVGTIVYCVCQWIISSLLVVHLSPMEESVKNAGLLQLSISITNIFLAIANYNMRTYQISDTDNEYTSGDYVGMRFVTTTIALLMCVVYVIVLGYSAKTVLCITVYMIFKLSESFCDVLHGVDQKNYRMDYVGISFAVRGIVTVAAFALSMVFTKSLMVSVCLCSISAFLVIALYDVKCAASFESIRPVFNGKTILQMLVSCLPSVVSSAAFIAISSVPRQFLEGILGEEALGYYGTIATPLVVVQVLATSIFNPMLTDMSLCYSNRDIKGFLSFVWRTLGFLAIISGVIYVCVLLLGELAVGIVFGSRFVPYAHLMYGIVGCTVLYAVCWFLCCALIIMRKLKVYMIASLVTLAFSALSAKPFINVFGMNGVSVSIMLAYVIHIAACTVVIYIDLKNKRKKS